MSQIKIMMFQIVILVATLGAFGYAAVGPNWVEQWGITWTFDKNISTNGAVGTYQYGQFVNGDYWIVGPVNIVSITPESVLVSEPDGDWIKNGSQLNPVSSSYQGYDNKSQRSGDYKAELNVALGVSSSNPLNIATGSLVSTISRDTSKNLNQLKTAAVLTVLNSVPPVGSFRPGFHGNDKIVRHNLSDINSSFLKNLPLVSSAPANLATEKTWFSRPWIQHRAGWQSSSYHPVDNMPVYGREMSKQTSAAALYLNMNYPADDKQVMLINYIQLGIDIYSLVKDAPGHFTPDGGNNLGRKLPLMVAAKALNDISMNNLLAKTGEYISSLNTADGYPPSWQAYTPTDYCQFQEDGTVFYVTKFDVDITHSNAVGFPAWNPDSRITEATPYEVSDIGLPEWAIRHSLWPHVSIKGLTWTTSNYRDVAGCSHPAIALAAHIMGLKDMWNHPALFDYADRYMRMIENVDGVWGTGTGTWANITNWQIGSNGVGNFVRDMWSSYRANYGPIWPNTGGGATPTTFTLSISAANGTVTKLPSKTSYSNGEVVTLTATPNTGYTFSGWSGSVTGTTNPITVTMDTNKSVTASFSGSTASYTLTATAANGTVTKSPSKATYASGEAVTLTAAPNTGYSFANWTGGATGTTNPVTITMNANKTVTANFVQQSTNDNFVNAIAITSSSGQTTTSNTGCTKETGEPSHAGYAGGRSLWWSWTAPASGQATINTSGSTIDTLLAAYTGSSVSALTMVTSNDDSGGVEQSQITFSAIAGTTYRIAVDGYNLETGTIVLSWNLPAAAAYTLSTTATNGTVTKSPNKATYASGETVTITAAPNTGYSFANWTGDAAGTTNPVTITMNANKTVTANFVQQSTNDNFVNAIAITSSSGQTTTSNVGYTKEIGEPSHAGYAGGCSLWWSWTAPASGQATINTFGSTIDTLLAAYTGSSVSALTMVTSNDDSGGVEQSQITFSAIAGTTYRIAVDGYNLETGTIVLSWNLPAAAVAAYTLSATATNGTVTKSPNKATYASGETVTLTAAPNTGYSFANWTGGVTGTTNPVTITMNSNKTVTANFTATAAYTLSVTAVNGTVTKSPSKATYAYGEVVTMTAVPNSGYRFTSWSGSTAGTTNPITITMNANKMVTAGFAVATYTLSIAATNGTITKKVGGVATTATSFAAGTVVELTAAANTGYTFGSWTGSATGTTNPISITIDANKSVTAGFTAIAYTLSTTATNGTVAKSPNAATYTYGQVVTLTAAPSTGYSFGNWSGDAAGTTNPVTVTINGNKSVTASFTQNTYTLTTMGTNGAITKSPEKATYNYGETVTLTAVPAAGYSFGTWSGSITGTTSPATVVINGNKSITANFTQLTLASGLTAHLMFDDYTGTTARDISGSGNTATLVGTPVWGRAWAKEDYLRFTTGSQAAVVSTSTIRPDRGTVALWVVPENLAIVKYFFGHMIDSTNRIALYTSGSQLAISLGDTTALRTGIAPLAVNTPYHLALTWDGTSYAVYVNGISKAVGTYTGLTQLAPTADIGHMGNPASRSTIAGFKGIMDDVRLYSRALSANEITALFNTYDISQQTALAFAVSGPAAYQASGLPADAVFNAATQTFTWTPWYNQTGDYAIAFTAAGQPTQNVTVTVHDVNLADWYRNFLNYTGKLN